MAAFRKFWVSLAVLLAVYGIAVLGFKPPAVGTYQSQWDENVAKGQQFIFGEPRDVVIVGSSLSNRFPQESLGSCFYNLGFSGESAVSGLELLKISDRAPKLVLVEFNIIEAPGKKDFLDRVNHPLARISPLFRVDFKPINYLLSVLRSARSTPQRIHEKLMQKLPDPRQVELGLSVQRKNLVRPVESQALRDSLANIKTMVEGLEAKGVQVLFFEMPVDPSIQNLARTVQIREAVNQTFGPARVLRPWSPQELADAQTVDGIHLVYSSAYRLGRALAEKMRCGNKPTFFSE